MHKKDVIEIIQAKGFTEAEAEKIIEVYKRVDALLVDPSHGFKIASSAFWDAAVMERALKQANE